MFKIGEVEVTGLTDRVVRKIRADFAEKDVAEVSRLFVEECGRNLPLMNDEEPAAFEPMRLAVLHLAQGDVGKLLKMIEAAKHESRDVQRAAYFIERSLEVGDDAKT